VSAVSNSVLSTPSIVALSDISSLGRVNQPFSFQYS
jgi:hypothetical protein